MADDKKEFNEWLDRATEKSLDGIEKSTVFASIVTGNSIKDPLCALQLGLSLQLDKPIFLIVDKRVKLSASLMRAAQGIVRVDPDDPQDMKRASEALAEFAKTVP